MDWQVDTTTLLLRCVVVSAMIKASYYRMIGTWRGRWKKDGAFLTLCFKATGRVNCNDFRWYCILVAVHEVRRGLSMFLVFTCNWTVLPCFTLCFFNSNLIRFGVTKRTSSFPLRPETMIGGCESPRFGAEVWEFKDLRPGASRFIPMNKSRLWTGSRHPWTSRSRCTD